MMDNNKENFQMLQNLFQTFCVIRMDKMLRILDQEA